MKLFKYALGVVPSHELSLEYWGERRGQFPDLDTALHSLFLGHPFPAALAGRRDGRFIAGISLAGAGDHEVVQVWSTEAEYVKPYRAAFKAHLQNEPADSRHHSYVPHDGFGNDMGIACEIHVGMIARFQTPKVIGYLTDGSTDAARASPAGRMALSFTPQARSALQLRMFQAQLANIGVQHELGEQKQTMREQLAKLSEGVLLMTSYCNGTNTLMKLRQGDRAAGSEPYRLFQTRVYLGEELGLIANLADMDHRDMTKLEDWLFREDRWKKLLPYPKCILITRIRRDEKKYENVFESVYHNAFNMESLVWIRDGDNVWRFATDLQFEERVFPTGDDAPVLVRRIQELIWKKHYAVRGEDEWPFRSNTKEEKVMPEDAACPVAISWKDEATYPTLQAFLDSEHYPHELDISIQRRASEAVRVNSRERMPFALLLQGLIDFKGVLNIPPGTDIFDFEQQRRFIQTVSDFSAALTDATSARKFSAITKATALVPGNRIVGWRWEVYSGKYSQAPCWGNGGRRVGPFVFTVHHVEPRDPKDTDSKDKIFVHHNEFTKRWVYDGSVYTSKSPFTKKMGVAEIVEDFLPLDMPLSLAASLLEDRNWKRENTWAVPPLAQWNHLRKQFDQVNNEEPLRLKMKGADDL